VNWLRNELRFSTLVAEQYQLWQRESIGKLQIEELGADYGGVLVDE
jgi:hypothetical protein